MGSTAPVIPPGFSLEPPPAPQPAVTPHVPEGFHVEGQTPAGPQIPDGFHLAPEPTIRADHPGLGDYVRRMVFGGPQGETSLGRAFPSMSGAVMTDVPTTQLPTIRAEEAIPSEAQLGNVQGTGAGATARNVGRGVVAGLSGLTTPENLGLLAATGGVGAVPAEAIGWGAAGGRAAQAAMSAYFAYQMAHGATDAVKQAYEMHQQGDDESAAKALGFAGTQGMMAALGLRHTVHETRALGKTKVPTPEFMRPGEEPPPATGPYNREPQPPGGPSTPGSSPGEPPTEQAVQPKAPPPSDVERIGPRTPNPPTASHPTAPESPQTISLQLEQLANGKRKVVMIPKGTVAPDQYPEGSSLTNDGMGNVYVFDPQQIKRAAIKSAARTNRLNEILGHADMGMGAPDKSELQGEPAAVVARAPDGTEVHSVATDETNAPTAIAAASQLTPEGGSVSLEPVEAALKSREEQQPEPSPAGVPPAPAIPEGFHVEEAQPPAAQPQPPAVQRAPVSPEVAEWAKQSNLWLKQQGIFGGTAGMNRVLDPEVVYHLARSVAGDVVRGSVSLKGAAARIATRLRQSNRQVLNAKGSQKVQAAVESALQDYTRLLPPPAGERVSPLRQSIIEPQALKRLERASKRAESVGAPENPRTVLQDEKGTMAVGKITTGDWLNRVQEQLSPKELTNSRNWYADLESFFEHHFGAEEGPKYALAWLLGNQNESPSGAMRNVQRAADQVAGRPKYGYKAAGLAEKKLLAALRGEDIKEGFGAKLSDFVDSALQKKQRTFMADDPRGGAPAVIDVWANRDAGKLDSTTLDYLNKRFGPEAVAHLKVDGDSIGETDYEYGSRFYNKLAQELNAQGYDGGNWTPAELQAVGWVSMQKAMEKSPEFPQDIIDKNSKRVSIGMDLGAGAPWREGGITTIPPEHVNWVIDQVASRFGVKILRQESGKGAYLTDTEPSTHLKAFGSKEAIEDFMASVGYALQQTSVIAARSIKSGKSYHLDVLQTNGRDMATDEGRLKVYNALREAGAPDDMVIGFQPIERDGQPGIRLIKWRGKWGDKKIAAFNDALAKSTPEGYEMAIKHGPLELTEASNQWEEQPNGQGYLGQLDDRGRQSERQWLERELRPAVAKRIGAKESGAGKPPERRDTGVYLGSGLGALQPYLDKFAKEDIIPALKATTRKATGAWDDIKRLLAPQTRGGQAKEAAGSLREMMGTLAHKEAVAHASLEGFRKALYAEPKEYGVHGLNIIDAIEGRTPVNHLRPDLQQFASTVKDLYEERKDLLQKMGLVQNFIDNYFTHLYKDPGAAQAWTANWSSKRPMQGKESFRKQRVYPTLRDALEDPNFTLEAKFDNPVDYVYAGLAQMDKSIEAHELFEDWKDKGYLKFSRHGPPSPGWAAIDDKIFTVHGPRRGAVKLPTGANISPEDVEVFGKREMGRYYAPDQIAQVANNYLSPTLRGKAGFDAWMALKGAFNAINLGFSAFHLLTTALNSATSDIALGVRQVSHGKLVKAAGNVAAGMSYVVPGIRDLIKGTSLEKVYNGTASNPTAMEVAIVDAIKSAGGSPMQNTHGADLIAGMKKAWAEGNPLGAAARAVNPLLWSQGTSDLIMKRVVPRVKLAAFAKAAEYEISRNPTMTPEEARAKFGQILDSMDNRFGQLNQNNMLMRGIVKDTMNAIVGRPGWTVGFFREVMGGASDVVGNISDILKGKSTEISHRTAYTIALVLGGAALNGVATALLTQSQPKGTDYIAPRDGGVNEDGKPSRIVLPLYLSKDVLSWATRPVATFKAKLAQPLMVGMDLATNRDFQMHKIYGDGSLGISNYLVHLVFPYSLSGAMQNVERGQTKLKTVLPFVGIMPASSRVGQSKAESIIQNWKDEQRSQTAPVPTEHSKARSQIYKAAQSKDLAKAQQLGKDAEAKGSMTPKDVNQAITRARTSPLVQDIKTVTDLGTVLKAFDAATPDERKTIQQEVRKKVVQARSKSYKWTPEMRELANRYFHIQPSAGGDFQAPKGIF